MSALRALLRSDKCLLVPEMDHVVRQNCKVSPLDLSGPKGPPCLRRARLVLGGGPKDMLAPLLGVWGGHGPVGPPPLRPPLAGTHAYFYMKQDTEQKKCECIFTSTENITFDITGYKHMSQQRTNFVRQICIGNVHQSCLKCQC